MQSPAKTVAEYVAGLPPERRAVIAEMRAFLRERLDPLIEEGMLYGMIGYYIPHRVYPPGYHCDPRLPLPYICLAAQKNYFSLYLSCAYGPEREAAFRAAWAKTGKRLDMGKACVRFKCVEDLALDVLADTIRRTTVQKFIEHYEAAFATKRKPTKATQPKRKAAR